MANLRAPSGLRQHITVGVLILVLAMIIWQMIGLFGGGGGGSSTAIAPMTNANNNKHPNQTSAMSQLVGSPSSLPQAHLTPNAAESDANLVKMQQDTQEKYLNALNELQVLKVNREIAVTNQAIMTARLAAVAAEKKMTDILSPPAPTPQEYAQNLVNPSVAKNQTTTTTEESVPDVVTYTVVSVSLLQNQWGAVMGSKGNLYSVKVGDILPPDRSKVIGIDKSGVTLLKDGEKVRISMVPVI